MAIGRIPEPGTGIPESIIAAKGDILTGTANDTPAVLSVGTNGHTLVADSAEATGLKWAAPAGGGKVLQVVSATTTTEVSNSTTSYTDTTLTATITPTLATSKILVLVSQNGLWKSSGNAGNAHIIKLVRGATDLIVFADLLSYTDSAVGNSTSGSVSYLDSPSTTSATTYKTQFKNFTAASLVRVQNQSPHSSITLLEIGA
jgi:hypothetical protein